MKKRTGLIATLVLVLFLCVLPTAAEEVSGSIHLILPGEGVEMTLYKVAVSDGMNFRWSDEFENCGIQVPSLGNADELNTAAEELEKYALENGINGTVGTTSFSGLTPGLYLVVQSAGMDSVEIQSAFVPLPYVDNGNLSYHAELLPKYSAPGRGRITVTKQLVDIDGSSLLAEDDVFYVALFQDEDRSVRASDVKSLVFQGGSAAGVVFDGLSLDKNYYVGETNADGVLITSGILNDVIFVPEYNTYSIHLTKEAPDGTVTFNNVFADIPDGYYYDASLTITKKTVKGGKPFHCGDVFYAVVFEDEEHTESISDVIELEMNGGSSVSQTVSIPMGGESMTVYVAETDIEGVPIKSSSDFEISLNKDEIVFDMGHLSDSVAITNTFPEESETPGTQPGTTSEIPGNSTPGNNVRTGDESPIIEYLLIALIALVTVGVAGVGEWKKRKSESE